MSKDTWCVFTERDQGRNGWQFDEQSSSAPQDSLRPLVARWKDPRRFPQLDALTGLPATQGIPIITAAWDDEANRWALILRGRGGVFGAAGTTQIALAPNGIPLADAWPAFCASIGLDGVADPSIPGDGAARLGMGALLSDVESALGLLAQDATVATVDNDPTSCQALYSAVTRVIPETAARHHWWATCHVPTEIDPSDRIITGSWPGELTHAWPKEYRRLTVVSNRVTSSDLREILPRHGATWRWVASGGAAAVAARSRAQSVAQFLVEADRVRPLTASEVAAAVRSRRMLKDSEIDRLAKDHSLVRELVAGYGDAAYQLMGGLGDGHPLLARLVAGFLADEGSPGRSKVLESLRLEAESGGRPVLRWGRAVRDAVDPSGRDPRAFVRILEQAVPAPPDDDTRRRLFEPWLRRVGLQRVDAPDWFGFDIEEAVRLAQEGRTEQVRQFLGDGPDQLDRAGLVLKALGAGPSAAQLFERLARDREADYVDRLLTLLNVGTGQAAGFIRELADVTNGDGATPEQRQKLAIRIIHWCGKGGCGPSDDVAMVLLSLATGESVTQLFPYQPAANAIPPELVKKRDSRKWPTAKEEPVETSTDRRASRPAQEAPLGVYREQDGSHDSPGDKEPWGLSRLGRKPDLVQAGAGAHRSEDEAVRRRRATRLVPITIVVVVLAVLVVYLVATFLGGGAHA